VSKLPVASANFKGSLSESSRAVEDASFSEAVREAPTHKRRREAEVVPEEEDDECSSYESGSDRYSSDAPDEDGSRPQAFERAVGRPVAGFGRCRVFCRTMGFASWPAFGTLSTRCRG
jgi:hypothetical protein